MTVDRHIRLSDEEASKLKVLHMKSGYSESEVIRLLIDNADDVTISKINVKRDRDDLILANLKYMAYLFSNATNNLNQLSKAMNQVVRDGKFTTSDDAIKKFNKLSKQITNWREEMRYYARNKGVKE